MGMYRRILATTAALMGFTLVDVVRCNATCFEPLPLNDLMSRDPAKFKDLRDWVPPANSEAKEVKDFLSPSKDEYVKVKDIVNIDFYYVTFKAPSNKALKDVFKDIRLQFGSFARGQDGEFDFLPYGKFFELYAYSEANRKKWESDDPIGALMSFKLDTQFPHTKWYTKAGAKRLLQVVHPWGDVQATCTSTTDFIFSTVKSLRGWSHPVAGNRGFGLRDAGGGNWMFYSKAVDRESTSVFNKVSGKGVFCYGHLFWLEFYANMKNYLDKNGMAVQKIAYDNHGTVRWPFGSGPPPKQPPCE
jgi:hypothetical protein